MTCSHVDKKLGLGDITLPDGVDERRLAEEMNRSISTYVRFFPLIGALLGGEIIVETGRRAMEKVSTACVGMGQDGIFVLSFNPFLWLSLTPGQRNFVILHEITHLLHQHIWRWGDFPNKELANIAADAAVNESIRNSMNGTSFPAQLRNQLEFLLDPSPIFPETYELEPNGSLDIYYAALVKKFGDDENRNKDGRTGFLVDDVIWTARGNIAAKDLVVGDEIILFDPIAGTTWRAKVVELGSSPQGPGYILQHALGVTHVPDEFIWWNEAVKHWSPPQSIVMRRKAGASTQVWDGSRTAVSSISIAKDPGRNGENGIVAKIQVDPKASKKMKRAMCINGLLVDIYGKVDLGVDVVPGSTILTTRGRIPVEQMNPGDLAVFWNRNRKEFVEWPIDIQPCAEPVEQCTSTWTLKSGATIVTSGSMRIVPYDDTEPGSPPFKQGPFVETGGYTGASTLPADVKIDALIDFEMVNDDALRADAWHVQPAGNAFGIKALFIDDGMVDLGKKSGKGGGGGGEGESEGEVPQEWKENTEPPDEHREQIDPRKRPLPREYVKSVTEALSKIAREHQERSGWGDAAGGVFEVLKALLKSRVNWRGLIEDFVSDVRTGEREYTRKRPTRRISGEHRWDYPGTRTKPEPYVMVIVDTSGSVHPSEMTQALAEANEMAQTLRVAVMDIDTVVQQVYWWRERYPQGISGTGHYTVMGRGGTNFDQAFLAISEGGHPNDKDHILEEKPEKIIVFTDGDVCFPEPYPGIPPTLWVMTKQGNVGQQKFGHAIWQDSLEKGQEPAPGRKKK